MYRKASNYVIFAVYKETFPKPVKYILSKKVTKVKKLFICNRGDTMHY